MGAGFWQVENGTCSHKAGGGRGQAQSGNGGVPGAAAGSGGRSRRTGGPRGREDRALTPCGQAREGGFGGRASTPSELEEDRASPGPQGGVGCEAGRESHS